MLNQELRDKVAEIVRKTLENASPASSYSIPSG